MSLTVQQVTQLLEVLAPLKLAFDWDNVGLQVGRFDQKVQKVMVTLTVTEDIVKLAADEKVDLIISHHPLIFKSLKNIRVDSATGKIVTEIIKNNISLYVSHTNLDQAQYGLNFWLSQDLGLENSIVLAPSDETKLVGLGRLGYCNPITLKELVSKLKVKWQTEIRVVGSQEKKCQKIAVCGGSGGDLIKKAYFSKADVFITGDVSYHDALEAKQYGVAVIDGGHFNSEKIMVSKVGEFLQENLDCSIVQSFEGDNPFLMF